MVKSKTTASNVSLEGTKTVEKEERGQWGGKIFFILTAVGCAVGKFKRKNKLKKYFNYNFFFLGLGNIWRFPYVAYENGGSAFLIPYFISSLLIGIPMLHFEMNYGQFVASGCGTGYKKLFPVGQGIGWVMVVSCVFIASFYIMIMAYILIYLVKIVTGQSDEYTSCNNPWNTLNCVSSIKNLKCLSNVTENSNNTKAIFLNNTCYYAKDDNGIIDIRNNYFTSINGSPVSATEEYFDRYILQRTEGFDNLGEFNVKVFTSLSVCWMIIFLFAWKGVKIMGKISLFTSVFPYIVIIAFLVKSCELEGAYEGMKFYILNPDFSRLLDYKTWLAASTQLIFSFGIGMGMMPTLASYNKKNHNVFTDVLIIGAADIFMSVVGGAVVFSILGFLATKTGKLIPEVVTSGATLAFVVYPEATSLMSYSDVWTFSYFLMLFLLGASTEICYVDLIATSFYDTFQSLRKHRTKIVLIICIVMYLCGVIFCFNGGIYYFTIFNEYTTGFNLVGITIIELLAITIFYGVNNYMKDIRSMIGNPKSKFATIFGPTGNFMKYCWLYITPSLLCLINIALIYSFATGHPSYGVGEKAVYLPSRAKYFGYTLTFSTFIPLIIFFFVNTFIYLSKGRSFKQLFKPMENWPSFGGKGRKLCGDNIEVGKKNKSTTNSKVTTKSDTEKLIKNKKKESCDKLSKTKGSSVSSLNSTSTMKTTPQKGK